MGKVSFSLRFIVYRGLGRSRVQGGVQNENELLTWDLRTDAAKQKHDWATPVFVQTRNSEKAAATPPAAFLEHDKSDELSHVPHCAIEGSQELFDFITKRFDCRQISSASHHLHKVQVAKYCVLGWALKYICGNSFGP